MAAATKVKISYKDVVNFFNEADSDMAALILSIIKDNMAEKAARRAKMSVNLRKARAAKGKGSSHPSSSVKADPSVQAEVAAGIPVSHRGPGRPRRVVDANANEAADGQTAIAESA